MPSPVRASKIGPSPDALPTSTDRPWLKPGAEGEQLGISDFLTTLFAQTSRVLRKAITVPYASAFDLSVSEWRILAILGEAKSLPFGEIVERSTADKGLVSRTLRILSERGLVLVSQRKPGKKTPQTWHLSAKGKALYDQVIPIARSRQAAMLRVLSVQERTILFSSIHKLLAACESGLPHCKDTDDD